MWKLHLRRIAAARHGATKHACARCHAGRIGLIAWLAAAGCGGSRVGSGGAVEPDAIATVGAGASPMASGRESQTGATDVQPNGHRGDSDGLSVAGVPLRVPEGCELLHRSTRGGTIRCDTGVLDWLEGTGDDLDDLVEQLTEEGLEVQLRLDLGCQLGTVEGSGRLLDLETQGRKVPMLVCVAPFESAHAVVRCMGFDPTARPSRSASPVPPPCDQILPWQPVLLDRSPR